VQHLRSNCSSRSRGCHFGFTGMEPLKHLYLVMPIRIRVGATPPAHTDAQGPSMRSP